MGFRGPRYLKEIENTIKSKLKLIKTPDSESLENQQIYHEEVLQVYNEAFTNLIEKTTTNSNILSDIKAVYEKALKIRNERLSQFITEDRVYGISVIKQEREERIQNLIRENQSLRKHTLSLTSQITNLKKDMGKLNDDKFSNCLNLMRERDARYTLYYENLELQLKLKELDGSSCPTYDEDPVVLRIALDRCREQLSLAQTSLKNLTEEYSATVPRREYDILEAKYCDNKKTLQSLQLELEQLQEVHRKLKATKKFLDEELSEVKERCSELERAGTPRPEWDICADFIGGGRDRWRQLASGLSSRNILRVLLKELGPAAESEHLEYFDGLGMDPAIPPYLRYKGKVRNLRLSRREINVIINDIWLGKRGYMEMSMQDYVTKYFEDRYQQPAVRAEWAYNLCAGVEQMLDEPQVKLFWAVVHAQLSERVYWGLRDQWTALASQLRHHANGRENVPIEEFERAVKATFPNKSEVDVKNLSDVARKQLKLKTNNNLIDVEKLLQENEEGFDRTDLGRELYRQRQLAQDRYIRELVGSLGGKRAASKPVTVDSVKRAFAILDPAIDHIRMERYIRWAFSDNSSALTSISPITLRTLAVRLATGDIERVGPRYKGSRRSHFK